MTKAYKSRGGQGILDKDGKSIFERDVATLEQPIISAD